MGTPEHTLVVLTGPTGSGKSALALQLAQTLGTEIISADSRQIYKHIPIGTAAPTLEERAAVPHHFVDMLELDQYYSAAQYEHDVLDLLPRLWERSPYVVMCGGSMMYVDAVCYGIDNIPTVSPQIREQAWNIFYTGGIEALRTKLAELDPVHYSRVDINNPKRMVHAIEVSMQAGVPYSTLCTGEKKQRPWRTVKMAIDMPREMLFERINKRVDTMIEAGWEDEARAVYHLRHLNSLNTVGYKELFALFSGHMDRDTAIARIAKNTRVYAKKQLTWLKRQPDTIWIPYNQPLSTTLALL
ncbi:MAG: tRNA (adenosine(37)-N6)-dimethylallyltransferase MiaA [Paramuribaculum sp.]|nr:tRNA (adenosine(37)-N6)-dimethylallyltransferase MiaA [Paramuribaculum sp.]